MKKKEDISIIKKKNCFGCYACVNACFKDCVSMHEDEEGFRYPQIDYEKCNSCGNCVNSCPSVNYITKDDRVNSLLPVAYSTYALDEEIRKQSSSGGVFSLLANYVLSQQGVVFGAVWEGIDYVKHIKAASIEELPPLRTSKYLQSDVGFTFRETKRELEQNKLVLFAGTPCQIAGLKTYLKKEYIKLITCDLVCHGVPSAKIFRKFLEEMNFLYNSKPVAYYRDGSKGKLPSLFTMDFENGQSITLHIQGNIFNHGFTANLFQRQPCVSCNFAKIPRIADITLGDDVRTNRRTDKKLREEGLSFITINTQKGLQVYENIKNELDSVEYSVRDIRMAHIAYPPYPNIWRKCFFRDVKNGKGVLETIDKYCNNKIFRKLRGLCVRFVAMYRRVKTGYK